MSPTATYRLQLHRDFRVKELIEVLDYLQSLGVDTIYASPILTANPGSTHGYDVTNPEELNPEITDPESWDHLHRELRRRDMRYLQDIVPNHTALSPHNVWLQRVIGKGRESSYAHHFDIDWDHPRLPGRLQLPVLGQPLEEVMESDQIQGYRGGLKIYDRYWEGPEADRNAVLPVEAALQTIHLSPVHWQGVSDFINYRRFFTVNELIGMRTEDERVFADLHRRTLEDVKQGRIHHLRIDHVDGLLDPGTYLRRLRNAVGPQVGIYVEKILEPGEQLPADWPVQGTTGYDFLAATNRLLTNEDSNNTFSDLYESLTDAPLPNYESLVFRNKLMLVREHFPGELSNLVRRWSDHLPTSLRQNFAATLAHWLAAFPVYRIYPTGGVLTAQELSLCLEGAHRVLELAPEYGRPVLAFVNWLAEQDFSGQLLETLQRTQQLSGPLMAKGVEDTTFYQFWRLAHLNEVGGSADPTERLSVRAFHRFVAGRPATTMNATATHDTKRGEDGRAFLQALTFYPEEWARFVTLATELLEPEDLDPRAVYLVLQSVVAGYPLHKAPERANLRPRLHNYLEKALREGKELSDWAAPDLKYENKLKALADRVLDNPILRNALVSLLKRIWPQTRHNSFAQTILKCTVPGFPDIYQGTESWDLSFVDPDNRRPVNYQDRSERLRREPKDEYDPALKSHLLRTLLQLRRDHAEFFRHAEYQPLPEGDQVLAFERSYEDKKLVVKIAKRAGSRVVVPGVVNALKADFGPGLFVGFTH